MTATPGPQPITYTSDPHPIHGQFRMEEWPDGSRTASWRGSSWETWTAEVELKAVPVYGVTR